MDTPRRPSPSNLSTRTFRTCARTRWSWLTTSKHPQLFSTTKILRNSSTERRLIFSSLTTCSSLCLFMTTTSTLWKSLFEGPWMMWPDWPALLLISHLEMWSTIRSWVIRIGTFFLNWLWPTQSLRATMHRESAAGQVDFQWSLPKWAHRRKQWGKYESWSNL